MFSPSVTEPASRLRGGSTQTINYVLPASYLTGNLEFAQDGTTFVLVSALSAGSSSYSWSVPSVDVTSARLRISYTDASGSSTVQSGFFEIDSTAPSISLSNLLGGDTVPGNTTVAVNWTASDANIGTAPIEIQVSSDSGVTYSSLATGLSNTGTYSWATPNLNSSTYRIRVRATDAVGNVSSFSASASDFNISVATPIVLVTYPNGAEYIHPGPTITTVTWSSSNLPPGPSTATIEYSANSGATWNPIAGASGIANTGSYSWSAPTVEASTYRIRVSVTDALTNVTSDASNADFTIDNTAPTLTITAPSTGGYVEGNSPFNITWTVSDNNVLGATPIRIEYSPNTGGATWNLLTAGVAAAPATYSWSVPNIQGSSYQIRITATDQAGQTQVATTGNFYVDTTNPLLSINLPVAAAVYSGGSIMNIDWTASDANYGLATPTPIQILRSTNSGTSWATIATMANTPPFAWTLPSVDSSTYRIRIIANDRSGRQSIVTTGDFIIDNTNPTVAVTSPNGGEVLRGGQSTNIAWTASDTNLATNPITLEYSINNGGSWTTIASGLANSSPYSWTVPAATNSQNCLVRVTAVDLAGRSSSDPSNAVFTIDSTNPSVTLTAPTGAAQYLQGGSAYNISWTASDATYALATNPIRLEVSTNSGTSYSDIVAATANTSPYSWTVPSVNSSTYRVRITATDAAGNTAQAASSQDFVIDNTNPSLSLTYPVGAETFSYNDTVAITWTASDTNFGTTPISIEYSSNGGTSYSSIATVAASPASYSWLAPSFSSSTYRIRLTATDLSGRQTVATSANFTVQPLPALVATPATYTYPNSNVSAENNYVHGARAEGSMVQLADGKYLLAGGGIQNFARTVPSASVYDPVTNMISSKAPMCQSRWGHSMTLLASGRVLVAGGSYVPGSAIRNTAEIYDPATDKWKQARSMTTARAFHGAYRRSDGKVIVMGGVNPFGAMSDWTNTTEIYDPGTDTWTAGPNLPTTLFSMFVVPLSSGNAMIIGGGTDTLNAVQTTYLYDATLNTFTATGSMNVARRNVNAIHFTAAELSVANDRVYVFGGVDATGTIQSSVEYYDFGSATWTNRTAMAANRRHPSTVKFFDTTDSKWKVFISGGQTGGYSATNSTQVYDVLANSYSNKAVIPNGGRYNASGTGSSVVPLSGLRFAWMPSIDGTGSAGAVKPYVQIYDLAGNSWTNGPSIGTNRYSHVSFKIPSGTHAGKIMFCAGNYNLVSSQVLSDCEMYNPTTNGIDTGPSMPHATMRGDTLQMADGRVVVIGGENPSGTVIANVALYNPATHTWSARMACPVAAMNRMLLELPGNKILVAGGTLDDSTGSRTDAVYWYDVDLDTWTAAASMPSPNSRARAVSTNAGRYFINGGWNGTIGAGAGNTVMWEYIPNAGPGSDSWTTHPSMTNGRIWGNAVFIENGASDYIIAMLGFNNSGNSAPTGTVEHFDLTTNTWTSKTSITAGQQRGLAGAYWIPTWNRLVIVGGWNGAPTAGVYAYNPSGAGSWSNPGSLIQARAQNYFGNERLDDGRLVVLGGANGALSADMGWEIFSFKPVVNVAVTGGDGWYNVSLNSGLGTVYDKLRQYIPPWPYTTGTSQVLIQDGSANSDTVDITRN